MANTSISVVNTLTGTANQIVSAGTNNPVIAIATNPIIPGTGSITIPSGTTGQRVLNGIGSMRVNTTTGFAEISVDGVAWVDLAVGGGGIASVTGTANRITVTAGINPIIDIAATYVGQASITTLGTITTGVWHGTAVAEIYGGTNQTTYALGDTLYSSAANTLSKLSGNITAVKQYLSQTGTGAVSAAPAWATISGGDITGAALSKTDDTNVTLTLGGTPLTALLRATSLTLGWAGQLSLARGGSNASLVADNGAIVYSTAAALALLASTPTAGKVLQSGASAPPTWSTPTYPSASGTAGKILRSDGTNNVYTTSTFADTYAASTLLYSNGANTVTGLATANSAVLVTSSAGVPVWSGTLTNGQIIIGSTGATPTAASLTAGTGITITPGAGTISIASSTSQILCGNSVTSIAANAASFMGIGGTSTTETQITIPMPKAGTIANLYIYSSVAAGVGQSYIFTVRKNGSSQAVTCTITGAAAIQASDTTHSFACVANDVIDILVQTSVAAATAYFGWGFTFTS